MLVDGSIDKYLGAKTDNFSAGTAYLALISE